MKSCPPTAALESEKPNSKAVAVLLMALIALAAIFITIHNACRLTRAASLVGINFYLLNVSDDQLQQAAKSEFPIGMTEQEAIQTLEARGIYEKSYYNVHRFPSEEEESTEVFIVRVLGIEFSLVERSYRLVLTIDTDTHRIKRSYVTYGLTGL